MTPFQSAVYRTVRMVPKGRVASYGGIAAVLGKPRAARGVGRALCALGDDEQNADVPWWRIVNRNGEISIRCAVHGATVQRRMLEREGVRFDEAGRIDWRAFGWTGPSEESLRKRSVALAIVRDGRATAQPAREAEVLVVQRPYDDDELPAIWGLPAASLRAGEDWLDAVQRDGRDKLGVAVGRVEELARGTQERARSTLEMRLYRVQVVDGEPVVPQPVAGVTQYRDWRWAAGSVLSPGAERGSLCCRLYLNRD